MKCRELDGTPQKESVKKWKGQRESIFLEIFKSGNNTIQSKLMFYASLIRKKVLSMSPIKRNLFQPSYEHQQGSQNLIDITANHDDKTNYVVQIICKDFTKQFMTGSYSLRPILCDLIFCWDVSKIMNLSYLLFLKTTFHYYIHNLFILYFLFIK